MPVLEFNEGPPPHVGWWLTVQPESPIPSLREPLWRWWSGSGFSLFCREHEDGSDGRIRGGVPNSKIRWSTYWPENARVPRLDPTDGHWTFHHGDAACPMTGPGELVWRGGHITPIKVPHLLSWTHAGGSIDIVAWRARRA